MHSKHLLLMLACCLIPIALIIAIGVSGVSLGEFAGVLPYALALLCPVMMIFMMRDMLHERSAGHGHTDKPKASGQTPGTNRN